MRAYYLPIVAGSLLSLSAFLPWIRVGDAALTGISGAAGWWILGLGLVAMTLAALSIATRKNSRHPILIVGLVALGIEFLASRVLGRSAAEAAWVSSQASALLHGMAPPADPRTAVGSGIYLGLTAAGALVAFGLTIVVRRSASAYREPMDDDV